jgi:hypothetical protein
MSSNYEAIRTGNGMSEQDLETDYLVIGSGAAGLAFVDELIKKADIDVIIVDRRHVPGGHWNDAYPFVRLHQPAARYGVNSRPLGSGHIDKTGLNAGLFELSTRAEIVSYYEQLMKQRLLPSGRVRHFPLCEYKDDGCFTSILSDVRYKVHPRKRVVDATYADSQVPSKNNPRYKVADGIRCESPGSLPDLVAPRLRYTVVGAGKTGIDTCLWLIENGAPPESIRWIMPRDAWLLDRENQQFSVEFFERSLKSLCIQLEAVAEAPSIDAVFARLEAEGELLRIDQSIAPSTYHCATVTRQELALVKTIKDIVRLGRIQRIDRHQIVLEHGTISAQPDCLYIDCSASGIPTRTARPVFGPGLITLQWVRQCQPTFSAAVIGHVENSYDNDIYKNKICEPIAPPDLPMDWLRMLAINLRNQYRWSKDIGLSEWITASRLDGFTAVIKGVNDCSLKRALLFRYKLAVVGAVGRLDALLASVGQ